MIKLDFISINGFKEQERTVQVKFSKSNVSVIYGENGCGKTTLLRILNAVFDQQDLVLLGENINWIKLGLFINDKYKEININKIEWITTDNDEEPLVHIGYNWSEIQNSGLADASSILFGVNRGITSTVSISDEQIYNSIISTRFVDNFRNRDEVHMFSLQLSKNINMIQRQKRRYTVKDSLDFSKSVLTVDNVDMNVVEDLLIRRYRHAKAVSTDRVQKALFDTLADACNTETGEEIDIQELSIKLSSNKDKLLSVLKQIEENTLRNRIISILYLRDIEKILEECKKNKLLAKLIYNMTLELEKEEGVLQSIRILKDIFDEHIGPNKYIEIDDSYIAIKFRNSLDEHRIHELSSGERHLLILLTVFIIQGTGRNFLMIDEPEISLNIKWQRKLLPLLSRLAPSSQIIVASHSPSIAKADTKYLVELK